MKLVMQFTESYYGLKHLRIGLDHKAGWLFVTDIPLYFTFYKYRILKLFLTKKQFHKLLSKKAVDFINS